MGISEDDDPKISARRSWFDWAVGAGPFEATLGVDGISSPRRSP